ncbi:DUF6801 domain-containing protein [Streptomyces sp. NPDC005752]|uniref:DUF6801 domain-containing protein n=1 Tax=Streptomyces sp. NPDC005752 TaxID=3157065 RepID=UPI0033D1D39A
MTGTRRRTARGAAVATAVLLGGMIPGAQAASGVQEIDAELVYACEFPTGKKPVKVQVTAKIPESAQAGQAIQPEDVALDVTLPEGALAGPADSAAATAGAGTRLSVDVSQGGRQARAEWLGTTAVPSPVPGEGELTLSTSGSVPYVTPGTSGSLTFEAGALDVDLELEKADGTPAEPPGVSLSCALDGEQETVLAAVDVADEEGVPEPAPSEAWPGEEDDSADAADVPEIGAETEESAGTDAPPCAGDPSDDFALVAYVTGYANAEKLKGATRFPAACTKIKQGPSELVPGEDGSLHVYQDSTADLEYNGKPQLPPTSGTFLTFGFVPTTAKLEMTQIPTGTAADGTRIPNIHSDLHIFNGISENRTDIKLEFMLRLYDVEVNGVPLDVGDACRTSRSFTLSLVGLGWYGREDPGYMLVTGGPLTGSVTIPPFSGCGVDEDLDDLFTASLSGVTNYVKQVQGAPCIPVNGTNCTAAYEPTDIPKATR